LIRFLGVYLNRTTNKDGTNIHASSGIRTYKPNVPEVKTHTLNHSATGIGEFSSNNLKEGKTAPADLVLFSRNKCHAYSVSVVVLESKPTDGWTQNPHFKFLVNGTK
jgi:hypothetical protein